MLATGSAGWISDVALALIEERGHDPAEAARRTRAAQLSGGARDDYGRDGGFGALSWRDGALVAAFDFLGGSYAHGRLTLRGVFPATVQAAAMGRPLSAFVDHPALRACRGKVTGATQRDDRLELNHEPGLITLEEAERRWAARNGGAFGT